MESAGQIFGQVRHYRRTLGRHLANLVWPPVCMACGADVIDPHGLCAECWRDMRFASGPRCHHCAHPMPDDYGGDGRCGECGPMNLGWGRARTATLYGGSARRLVFSLKYNDRPDIARPMAAWMHRAGADILARADLVVPVPLHWTRRVKRRLNQSAELSRRIARAQGIAHGAGILVRTRATDSQLGRNFEERRRNVAGAFACSRPVRVHGRRIVLVDDVMTTGATLNAATQVLRASGAKSVDVLVFSRVMREVYDEHVHI